MQCIYLKYDILGHLTTCTFRILFHAHQILTHQLMLHKTLIDELQKIKINPAEAIALDPQAKQHYDQAMESGDEVAFIPPFELFITKVTTSPSNQCITTLAIRLQCKSENINLIRELFTQMFMTPSPNIAYLNYTPSGLQSIIGDTNYHHMLTENNKYLMALVTIPDKNHTGLCALGFVLIQQNVPIVENKGPQCSVCSISGVCRNAMIRS